MTVTALCEGGWTPLRTTPVNEPVLCKRFGRELTDSICQLLHLLNGFYAFDGALHVFPDLDAQGSPGLLRWNERELWKSTYRGLADHGVCFAEDAFGNQFCAGYDGVYRFDPERGAYEPFAKDVDEWARFILDEPTLWTGCKLAETWQRTNGTLETGYRLVPKMPFVLGGEYKTDNLSAVDAVQGMRGRGTLALRVRGREVG